MGRITVCIAAWLGVSFVEAFLIISLAGLALLNSSNSTGHPHSTAYGAGFLIGGFIVYFLLLLVANLFYFAPSFVAALRNNRQFAAVFILNIFLGWTCIGWIISMVMGVIDFE